MSGGGEVSERSSRIFMYHGRRCEGGLLVAALRGEVVDALKDRQETGQQDKGQGTAGQERHEGEEGNEARDERGREGDRGGIESATTEGGRETIRPLEALLVLVERIVAARADGQTGGRSDGGRTRMLPVDALSPLSSLSSLSWEDVLIGLLREDMPRRKAIRETVRETISESISESSEVSEVVSDVRKGSGTRSARAPVRAVGKKTHADEAVENYLSFLDNRRPGDTAATTATAAVGDKGGAFGGDDGDDGDDGDGGDDGNADNGGEEGGGGRIGEEGAATGNANHWPVGSRVEGKFGGGMYSWYGGTVLGVYHSRTKGDGRGFHYDIKYLDGDEERHVPAHFVRGIGDDHGDEHGDEHGADTGAGAGVGGVPPMDPASSQHKLAKT